MNLNSLQLKFLAWAFWILSAASVANMAVFGFKFWTVYMTVNLVFVALLAFWGAEKEEETEQQFKELHARTNQPSRD